jgi:hypothetical protein
MDNLSKLGQDKMLINFDKYFNRGIGMREEYFNDEGVKYRKYYYRIVVVSFIFFIVFGFIYGIINYHRLSCLTI